MAKGRENGTTILLGPKHYKVGEVWGEEDRVLVKTEVNVRENALIATQARSMDMVCAKPREVLHT